LTGVKIRDIPASDQTKRGYLAAVLQRCCTQGKPKTALLAQSRIKIKIPIYIMTQSREPNDSDIFTRIAQVEYRLMKVENTQAELENTMTPGGYITEAFDRVLEEIDEVKAQNEEMKGMITEQNGKIDTILRHITGMGNS
jgi:peptidoglycan hydrolase CwlO-like protein